MAKDIVPNRNGGFDAYIWDERAPVGRFGIDDSAIRSKNFPTLAEAESWVEVNERDVIERFRAACAFRAGAPCAKREWAKYYAEFLECPELYKDDR